VRSEEIPDVLLAAADRSDPRPLRHGQLELEPSRQLELEPQGQLELVEVALGGARAIAAVIGDPRATQTDCVRPRLAWIVRVAVDRLSV
jgi:hypothetical protein